MEIKTKSNEIPLIASIMINHVQQNQSALKGLIWCPHQHAVRTTTLQNGVSTHAHLLILISF